MTAGVLIFLLGISIQIAPVGDDPAVIEAVAKSVPKGSKISLHRLDGDTVGAAMFSRIETKGDTLLLKPSFRLSPEEHYIVRLTSSGGEVLSEQEYRLPVLKNAAPKVLGVLPACKVLPANLLKFYIEFDQPMREGKSIFDHIELIDQEGSVIPSPWRRQEIWSKDTRRLTLWIHPGRVKQGVNLRVELGPVLKPEKKYTLRISKNIAAQNGKQLEIDVDLHFETSPEHAERVRTEQWTLHLPATNSRAPLQIQTPRAMDGYLMQRHVQVFDGAGNLVVTKMEWDQNQQKFSYVPAKSWASGAYLVKISEYLEDLSGNTPTRAFDQLQNIQQETGSPLELKFAL